MTPGSGKSSGEGIGYLLQYVGASLVAQMVKNLPTMRETWVRFLGWEDPLEKGKAIHSSTLACRIPSTEEPSRLKSMGSQRVYTTEQLSLHWVGQKVHSGFSLDSTENQTNFLANLIYLNISMSKNGILPNHRKKENFQQHKWTLRALC